MNNSPISGLVSGCLGFIALVALIICVSSVKIVSPQQSAVVVRFGTLDHNLRQSGLSIDPFAGYTYYDLTVQAHDASQAAATKDLQDINLTMVVSYKVDGNKLIDLYQNVGTAEDLKARIIDPALSQIVKQITPDYTAETIILKRGEVKDKILAAFAGKMDGGYITVTDLNITNIDFTNSEFKNAIERKQIAQQQAEQQKYELDRTKLIAEQNAVQTQALTDAILQQQAIAKWNGVLPSTIYMTGNSGTIFNIPLSK